jgi:hypothetical protein
MQRLPSALGILLLIAGAAHAAPGQGAGALQATGVISDTLRPPPGLQARPPAPPPLRGLPRASTDTITDPAQVSPPRGTPAVEPSPDAAATGARIQVRGRGEMGGAWTRMRPCAGVSVATCAPGALPQMAPDLDLVVRAEGRLHERWQIFADYDGARELRSANRFQLRYRGDENGFLRRVEIGDVRLDLPAFRALGSPLAGDRFGAAATASAGPLDLQLAFAERRGARGGREFTLDGGSVAERVEGAVEDAEYVRGQFYFLVDPRQIPGYPHLDVLALRGDEVPAAARVTAPALYRYSGREARDGSTPVLTATAGSGGDAISLTGPVLPLEPEADYEIHPSGLWVWLRSPLHAGEALALDHSGAGGPVLLRAVGEDHRPGGPTWEREMRQVYRLSGPGEVDLATVEVEVRDGAGAGDAALTVPHPAGGGYLTFLQLTGLDRAAPEGRVDADRLYRPGDGRTTPLYLVLPTLRPFADPPAVPAAGLDQAGAAAAIGSRAVPAIYDATEAPARLAGGRFRIAFGLRTTGDGALPRTFSLGALGVREGSETVSLDGRVLQRGVDYQIRYETGQVELLGGAGMAAGADSRLRVAFDQDPAFGAPPAQTVGLGGRVRLGELGEMRFLGVSEREGPLEPRPALGAEGGGMLLGAVGGDLRIALPALDRLLGAAHDAPVRSALELSGELAVSLPDPTREAVAFLDDFDRPRIRPVSLLAPEWRLGSAPASVAQAGPHAPPSFDAATATGLVWQHAYLDGTGRVRGAYGAREIDRELRALAGAQEEALHLTFAGGRAGPAWRSVTTVLSAAGTDLRDHGYLEFYLRADAEAHALVLDLGTVSEDAMAFDSLGATSGVHADGRRWGEGVLDSQWDPASEVWTEAHGDRELWPTGCRATPGEVYPLGDPTANCTRGAGRPQTEDLAGNGRLDTEERALRYTLDLSRRDHRWIARDTAETGTRFRLVRIPLGDVAGGEGALDDLRRARHLRITVVGDAPARLALTRMRFVGAGWSHLEQASTGRGLFGGDTLSAGVRVEAGPVGARTSGAFVPPPGLEQPPRQALDGDVPEPAAMALRFRGLAADERAEVRRGFPGRPASFLGYRRLRLWALAREGRWGDDGAQLVVRVGSATDGHYLSRVPLQAAASAPTAADWQSVTVEVERWLALRAEAEERLREPGGSEADLLLWSADGGHALVLPAGGRMPNLAAVREISIGVWNGGHAATDGEVWIDHLRLEGGAVDPGLAGHLSVALRLGEHLRVRLDHRGTGASFRNAPGVPAFQGEDASSAELSADLGGWLPEGWGVRAPVRLGMDRWANDPRFLHGSDLLPGRVPGLDPGGGRTLRGSVQLSRATASASPAARLLLDPWTLDLRMRSARDRETAHRREAGETGLSLAYDLRPAAGADRKPGVRWLPTRLGVRLRYRDLADLRTRTDGERVLAAGGRVERRAGGEVSTAVQPVRGVDGQLALGGGRYLPRDGSEGGGGDRMLRSGLTLRPALPDGLRLTADLRGRFALRELPGQAPGPAALRGGFENGNEVGARVGIDPHALVLRLAGEGPLAAAARRVALVEGERRVTVDSHFDRSDARPGWRYALALGGRETFGTVRGDSAALVAVVDRQTVRTRIRLGQGLDLNLSHERLEREQQSRWSPRLERETEWPAARLSWDVPELGGVQNLTLSTGYAARRLERTELATGLRREEREMRIPVQVAVAPGAWRLSYRADWRVQDRLWLGNRTERTVIDHAADARLRFAPPPALAALTEPIEVSLDYRAGDRRDCRLEPGWTGCTAGSLFNAQRSHTLGVRGSAGVRGGRLGLHLDLDDRADRIGIGSGRARLTLGLFGQFTVDARTGTLPTGSGSPPW